MMIPGRFFAFAPLLLLASHAAALIQPLSINYQGKLVNPATNSPQTGVALLTFKIFNAPSGGTALWTEGPEGVSVTNGVFSLTLGTNTALSRDLFLGASAYLEVTVNSVNGVADGTPMAPRQPLLMAPYAFTANQLSDTPDVRLIAGPTYSTFTSAGNLIVPGGVQASSGSFTNGITASSGTFTTSVTGSSATFTATGAAFGLTVSSGILLQQGTLDVNSGGGIDAGGTGIKAATATFSGTVTASTGVFTGGVYLSSSTLGCGAPGCGAPIIIWLKNANAGTINAGCVVIAATPQSFNTTTTANNAAAIGVVAYQNCAAGAICPIAIGGVIRVTTSVAVTAGLALNTAASACNAGATARSAGSFGTWLETTAGAGSAFAVLGFNNF